MALFHIQDDDWPMFVIAKDYIEAIQKWHKFVVLENDSDEDVAPPKGIQHVCDDDEIIP